MYTRTRATKNPQKAEKIRAGKEEKKDEEKTQKSKGEKEIKENEKGNDRFTEKCR